MCGAEVERNYVVPRGRAICFGCSMERKRALAYKREIKIGTIKNPREHLLKRYNLFLERTKQCKSKPSIT